MSNDDLAKTLDTSDDWIYARTGIKMRHIAAEGQMASDLAAQALRSAMSRASISPISLDGIIVATTTPDQVFPSTAAKVHNKLGMRADSFAFDVQAVCSGFLYAMTIGNSMIASQQASRIAVVGAEVMSRILDWEDRTTCVLFGDGAGAIILERAQNIQSTGGARGIIGSKLSCESSFTEILKVDGGVGMGKKGKIRMMGRETYKVVVPGMASIGGDLLERNGLVAEHLDWILPHQANQRITESISARMNVPLSKFVSTIEKHANTSAASIPLALDEYVNKGLIQEGNLILMVAAGGGITFAATLLRF